MKKRRILALSAALLLLAGCGSKGGSSSEVTANVETTEFVTSETTAEPVQEQKSLARSGEVRDITPAELIAEMNIGWNLGNSLDATGGQGITSETSWGNPKTTQAMIDAVSARGFNTIRIPVTWGGHFGAAPDYTIDSAWMERVQEVVNYAIDDDMYVILDSHHEEDWRIPDKEHIDVVGDEVYKLWAQIAENFVDYGDHLIFEGLNEPRMKGSPEEWSGGKKEGWECINILNQKFIDAVRSTGGNNEKRLLLVTTYASSAVGKAMANADIPDDPHTAFSIHAYTPYVFTYHANQTGELFTWDGSKDQEIDWLFNDLKKYYLNNNIPVIITEFGAVNKDGNDEDVARWVTKYLETAKENGVPCVWWDNGYYTEGNELFGIFDRKNCTWFTDTVVDAMMKVYDK